MNFIGWQTLIIDLLKFIWAKKVQHILLFISSLILYVCSFYPEFIKTWPIYVTIGLFAIATLVNIFSANYPAFIESIKNKDIQKGIEKLEKQASVDKTKITEYEQLKSLLSKFLDSSGVYREKVIDLLNLNEDYVCIAKSSEGMGDAFEDNDKQMLPFSKVLFELPGSIKPFERMTLYLIPVKNLPGLKRNNLRQYINKVIIPKVQKERVNYLKNVKKEIAETVRELSYKYVAYFIKGNEIIFETKNRKFIKKFVDAFIKTDSKRDIVKYTRALSDVIGLREFFLRVEWDAFADLNFSQYQLVEANKSKIYTELKKSGIHTLREMYSVDEEKLSRLLMKTLGNKITQIKAANISKKLVSGAKNVLDILEKAGVQI